MICDIINPSDAMTLKADDFEAACVAIAIVGQGQWGIKDVENEDNSSPVLFGWEDWLAKREIDLSQYIKDNRLLLADILDTVMLGTPSGRADLEAMLAEIPEERREAWIADRNDRRRSSLNDIEGVAHKYAKRLRELEAQCQN